MPFLFYTVCPFTIYRGIQCALVALWNAPFTIHREMQCALLQYTEVCNVYFLFYTFYFKQGALYNVQRYTMCPFSYFSWVALDS